MPHESEPVDRDAKHLAAIRQSLAQADESARAGDHAVALEWLRVVEAVGHDLSTDYRTKRERWQRVVRDARAAGQPAT